MKNLIRYFPLLFILFIACSSGEKKSENDPNLEEVKKEIKDVQVKTDAYLKSEYKEMVKEVEAFAMSTEAEFNELSEEANDTYADQKEEVTALQDSLNLYLKQIKDESAEDVDVVMAKIQKTRKALKESMATFQRVMNKNKDQKQSK